MKSVFSYANDLICVDSIHLVRLAREELQPEWWFLTPSERRGVSADALPSRCWADASPLPAADLPRGVLGFFSSFADGGVFPSLCLGVLQEPQSSLKWSNVIYRCSINPFCLFSTPCLGLGPSCLPMFFTVESFFNSPQGINDSFSCGKPSSPHLQLLSACVSKHRQHTHVNKTLSNSFLSSPGEPLEPHRTSSSPLIPLAVVLGACWWSSCEKCCSLMEQSWVTQSFTCPRGPGCLLPHQKCSPAFVCKTSLSSQEKCPLKSTNQINK